MIINTAVKQDLCLCAPDTNFSCGEKCAEMDNRKMTKTIENFLKYARIDTR